MHVCPKIRMGPGRLWAATNPDQHECQCGVYEWMSLSRRMHIIHDQQQPGRDTGNSLDSDPLSYCGSIPITAHAHLNTHTVVEWFLLVYKQHDSKQHREGKRFSSLHFQFTVYDWRKLGQKLKKELKQKSWRNVLTGLSIGWCSTKYSSGPCAYGWYCTQWASTCSFIS